MVTVGILGGGQLARMMIQARAAADLPLRLRLLTDRATDPAARLAGDALPSADLVLGSPRDDAALRAFLATVDVACFESEFQPAAQLEANAAGLEVVFRPSLEALATTQDKLEQKALYERLGIATSPFVALPEEVTGDAAAALAWLRGARESVGEAPVLKWARLGYDGKGTFFVPWGAEAGEPAALQGFLDAARERATPVFAEERVDFVRELAIVVSADLQGEQVAYPLVVSEQEAGICKRVFGPAQRWGVAASLEREAREMAAKIVSGLGLVGSFALEFFQTARGELWVNEMAPRVHNSGHYSIDACVCSQFENHLRAVGGLPLGEVTLREPCFAMLNLIGDRQRANPSPPQSDAFTVEWYEKDASRPGRKLGHLNALAADPAEIDTLLAELAAVDAAWLESLGQE